MDQRLMVVSLTVTAIAMIGRTMLVADLGCSLIDCNLEPIVDMQAAAAAAANVVDVAAMMWTMHCSQPDTTMAYQIWTYFCA